jgi:hypothetical protein
MTELDNEAFKKLGEMLERLNRLYVAEHNRRMFEDKTVYIKCRNEMDSNDSQSNRLQH